MRLRRSSRLSTNTFKSLFSVIKKFILIILVLYLGSLFFRSLNIKNIICNFNEGICPVTVTDYLSQYRKSNYLLLNTKKITSDIKEIVPSEDIIYSLLFPGTLKVNISTKNKSYPVNVYLASALPILTIDLPKVSSSSSFGKPTSELNNFIASQSAQLYRLWSDGRFVSENSSGSSNINYIFISKPDDYILVSAYNGLKQLSRYINYEEAFFVGNRLILRQTDQPDIIISIPFDEKGLEVALQSISYLVTIKSDAKVIDLSFKNPIIR